MSAHDFIRLDDVGRAVIRTRAWSRVVEQGTGELANATASTPPVKLAEAYMPAPIAWMLLGGSSVGAISNAVLSVQFGTLEGGLTVPQPLFGVGFTVGLQGPVIAATSLVVNLVNPLGLAPGERITVCIAPVVWPAWAVPELPRQLAALAR